MHTRDMRHVYLEIHINNKMCYKVVYFLRKMQTLWLNDYQQSLRLRARNFQRAVFTRTYRAFYNLHYCDFDGNMH